MSKLLISFLIIILSSCICDKSPSTLPKYKINLDLPIKERYSIVLTDFSNAIVIAAKAYEKISTYQKFLSTFTEVTNQDSDWLEYVQTVSEISGITLGESVMLSIAYELGCTSTLVRDRNDDVILGHNLDFKAHDELGQSLYEAHYYSRGELVYKSVELAGCFTSIHGVKPGKFAISHNLRYSDTMTNIKRIYQGFWNPSYNLKKTLEDAQSFEEAEHMLSTTPLSAAVYYILASQDKGVIISRDVTGAIRLDRLEGDNWFLVVTNTDLDKREDSRRKAAQDKIRALGQDNVSYESILDILSQSPNRNPTTISTTIQDANGYFATTMWSGNSHLLNLE
jgi:hypothetical protein